MLIASLFLALALAGGQDEKLLTYSQNLLIRNFCPGHADAILYDPDNPNWMEKLGSQV